MGSGIACRTILSDNCFCCGTNRNVPNLLMGRWVPRHHCSRHICCIWNSERGFYIIGEHARASFVLLGFSLIDVCCSLSTPYPGFCPFHYTRLHLKNMNTNINSWRASVVLRGIYHI